MKITNCFRRYGNKKCAAFSIITVVLLFLCAVSIKQCLDNEEFIRKTFQQVMTMSLYQPGKTNLRGVDIVLEVQELKNYLNDEHFDSIQPDNLTAELILEYHDDDYWHFAESK